MKSASDRARIAAKRRAEPEITWQHVPRLKPGEYKAYCRAAKIYRDGAYKRWVCAIHFDVLDDSLQKMGRLTWYLNLGSEDAPHATRRKKYWDAWVKANGGAPKRKDRLSPSVFVKRYAVVVVGDTAKNSKQELITGEFAYSVVKDVVRWETGTPALVADQPHQSIIPQG